MAVAALGCCLRAAAVVLEKTKRIGLQNLSVGVEYCYRYTKGDVYIMGMGHILY